MTSRKEQGDTQLYFLFISQLALIGKWVKFSSLHTSFSLSLYFRFINIYMIFSHCLSRLSLDWVCSDKFNSPQVSSTNKIEAGHSTFTFRWGAIDSRHQRFSIQPDVKFIARPLSRSNACVDAWSAPSLLFASHINGGWVGLRRG